MELLWSLLPIAAALWLGHLLVSLLWPLPRGGAAGVVGLALATGIGLGVAATLQFFVVLVLGVSFPGTLAVELLALVLLSVAVGRLRRTHGAAVASSAVRGPAMGMAWPALILATLVFAYIFVRVTQDAPFGDGDAIGIWNMRATFLLRCGGLAQPVFAPSLAHTDYPLLLPLLVVRGWTFTGSESLLVPALVAAAFTFSLLWLLVGAVVWRAGSKAGVVVAALAVGGGLLLRHGASQTADMPLAFFLLAALVSLTVAEDAGRAGGDRPVLIAGLCAGLAAFTKNEGLMFLLWITLAVLVRRLPLRHFLVGACFAITAVLVFKLGHAPGTDLIRDQDGSMLAKVFDGGRWQTILVAFLQQTLMFRGDAGIGGPGMFFLLVALFLLGAGRLRVPMAAVLVFLAGLLSYMAVFVLTPRPLEWHLVTALGRVLLHLHPVALFLFATTVRMPFEPRR